jgi:threonine/homoserine efflux transporter RhtA
MHAVHLGGSHYTQYLGMSAGITAVLLSIQPLLTAFVAARWMGERLSMRQWAGIATAHADAARPGRAGSKPALSHPAFRRRT